MVASELLGEFFPTLLLHTGPMETKLIHASSSQLASPESLIVSFLSLLNSRKEFKQDSSLVGQSYMVGEDKVSAVEAIGLGPLATM
jgi:hypothetical protein